MRKIKPKMTKQEKALTKINSFINEKCKPLHNVGIILSAFCDFLQEHRKLYDDEHCYLKPYLKGTLTSVVNKTKKFIEYNYIQEHMKEQVTKIKKIVEENFDSELSFEEKNRNNLFQKEYYEVDYRIYKTYACALICLSTVIDMFFLKEKDKIYDTFKEKLKISLSEFKIYNNFWQKEVQEIKVKLF